MDVTHVMDYQELNLHVDAYTADAYICISKLRAVLKHADDYPRGYYHPVRHYYLPRVTGVMPSCATCVH